MRRRVKVGCGGETEADQSEKGSDGMYDQDG